MPPDITFCQWCGQPKTTTHTCSGLLTFVVVCDARRDEVRAISHRHALNVWATEYDKDPYPLQDWEERPAMVWLKGASPAKWKRCTLKARARVAYDVNVGEDTTFSQEVRQ